MLFLTPNQQCQSNVSTSEVMTLWRYTNLFIIIIIMKAHCTAVDTNFQILWPINNVDTQYDHNPYLHPFQQIQVQVTFLSLLKIRDTGTTRHATLPAGWITQNFLKTNRNAYTHNRLTALFPGLPGTNLDFTEARDSEWQWHQLDRMQVCTSLQTDNHASTPPLSLLQAGCPSSRPTNSVKALKARKPAETRWKIQHQSQKFVCIACHNSDVPESLHYLFASLGVVGKTCPAVVQRVDEHQRHRTGGATRHYVLAEVDHVRVVLLHLKHRLDLVLESKVQRLCREVTNAVGQVTAPERQKACKTAMQTTLYIKGHTDASEVQRTPQSTTPIYSQDHCSHVWHSAGARRRWHSRTSSARPISSVRRGVPHHPDPASVNFIWSERRLPVMVSLVPGPASVAQMKYSLHHKTQHRYILRVISNSKLTRI